MNNVIRKRHLQTDQDISRGDRVKRSWSYDIFVATRPWSFTATITAVLLGSVLAYLESENFMVDVAILSFFSVLCVHCAANLVNTYFDYIYGVDTEHSDDKTLVDGTLKPQEIWIAFIVAYGIALLFQMVLHHVGKIGSNISLGLFIIGLALSYFYTGGIGLKYYAFGDIVIMCAFGPLIVMYCYLNQNLTLSWKPTLLSLPLVFHIEAMLHGNNIRDMSFDEKANVKTLALLLGKATSVRLYYVLLATPYLLLFPLIYFQSFCFLIPYLTVPMAADVARKCDSNEFQDLPKETAKLNLLFGLTYLLAIILNGR